MTSISTTTPARGRVRRTRAWCVGLLALGLVLGGAATAVGNRAPKRIAIDMGTTGPSPVPVVAPIRGRTAFNLASFNVLGYDHTAPGGTKKGYKNGSQRTRWAVQLLKENDVDVVGLQEFQPQQYATWVKKASSQYDIWPGNIETVGYLRNSIAWRKDKFAMVSNTWVKLPYFNGEVLRMPVVLLRSLATGQQFYVMNFQNPADTRGNATPWRLLGQTIQIALVKALRSSNSLPILWVGDMNSTRQVYCRVTTEAGMVSAHTGTAPGGICKPPSDAVVDWMFGSGVKFKHYQQLRTAKVRRTTDHHLITTKVVVPRAAGVVPPPPAPVTTCTTTTPRPTPSPTRSTTTPSTTRTPTPTLTATSTLTATPSPSGSTSPTGTTSPTATATATATPTVTCTTTTPAPVIFTAPPF